MITIKEIAKLAGVGRATVDRALKNRDGINNQTKEKIMSIANEHNYKPNKIGKALVYAKNKYIIGIVLNSLGNDFFDDIIDGLNSSIQAISDFGFTANFAHLKGYDINEQLNAIQSMVDNGAKCIIITPINDIRIANCLSQLANEGIKIITLNSDIECDNKLAYVGCDYIKSGKTAGNLINLLSDNTTSLLIVTGSMNLMGHKQRVDGIISQLKDNGNISINDIIENNDDELNSYTKVKQKLSQSPSINFICITAGGAKGALQAVVESNRPIKTITFDDTKEIKNLILSGKVLATIAQQPFDQGYNAIQIIFNHIVDKTVVEKYNYTDLNIKIKENI